MLRRKRLSVFSLVQESLICCIIHHYRVRQDHQGKSGIKVESILEKRVSMLMFLIFQNEMGRGGLTTERERTTLNERKKWSVTWSSSDEQLEGVTPEQQIKSRI